MSTSLTTDSDNGELVGKAVRESDIPREEVFVTTKLLYVRRTRPRPFLSSIEILHEAEHCMSRSSHHHLVKEAFEESLAKLNIEYVDLYLMHWPQASVDGRALCFVTALLAGSRENG